MYSWFLLYPNAYRTHLGASLVIKIESLGCSELGSLQLSPPLGNCTWEDSEVSFFELGLASLSFNDFFLLRVTKRGRDFSFILYRMA